MSMLFFFFNDTATTEIYTLSLRDALPIWLGDPVLAHRRATRYGAFHADGVEDEVIPVPRLLETLVFAQRVSNQQGSVERSEEHTSELQSRQYLVCRLLLEKKKI